jgi:hypothetical protein
LIDAGVAPSLALPTLAWRPRRSLVFVLGLGLAAVLRPAVALGQGLSPDKELAAGDAAVRARTWEVALAHYQAALQAAPSAKAALGAADILYRLGRHAEGYEAYAEIQRAYPKLGPADAAVVGTRLKELASKTGWLSVRVPEPGASVAVDSKTLGTSPVPALVRVALGSHEVHVTKVGFLPFEVRTEVFPDSTAIVDVVLVREATEGRAVVTAAGEPLRVLVDGVDVGATPWEGDLAPGAHEISGRTSTALAAPQTVAVVAGARVALELVASPTAAHLQIRTSDGQGTITVDGQVKGTGAFAADVAPGPHTVTVTRDGYQPFQKAYTLGPRETVAETVTLSPTEKINLPGKGAERAEGEGVYGGFGLAWLPAIVGMGTELETGCSTLGAASCSTPSPKASAGVLGYVGYTWNPVGFEAFLAAVADTVQQKATFNGEGGNSGTLPFTSPPRVETFTFGRFGGLGAVRARASFAASSRIRISIAGGLGLSYKGMLMKRDAVATDGSGLHGTYVPGLVSYFSPGISVDAAIHFRWTPTVAVVLGAEMWGENAGDSAASLPAPGSGVLTSTKTGVQATLIPTPGYHFASGPQVFLGPVLGMQFGP